MRPDGSFDQHDNHRRRRRVRVPPSTMKQSHDHKTTHMSQQRLIRQRQAEIKRKVQGKIKKFLAGRDGILDGLRRRLQLRCGGPPPGLRFQIVRRPVPEQARVVGVGIGPRRRRVVFVVLVVFAALVVAAFPRRAVAGG